MSVAAHRFDNELRYGDGDHPRQWHLTPPYVLDLVRRDLGVIVLDPCTFADNPTRARWFYTVEDDGLAQDWDFATIFVNPPYGKAREPWIERCIAAAQHDARVVLLVPAATDTRIFQRAASTSTAVVFVRGRVKFGTRRENRRQHAASHPSALLGWNTDLEACSELGLRVVSNQDRDPDVPDPASEPVVGGDGRTPIIDAVTGQQIHTPPGAK